MPTKKRLFVGLISVSMLIVLGLLILVIHLFTHRENLLNQVLLVMIVTLLAAVLSAVAFGIGGIVLTLWSARTIPPLQGLSRVAINLMYPVAIGVGKLIGIKQSVIQGSFIEVNNQMVLAKALRVPPEKVLLLTPHCLQRMECPHKITINVQNCKRCGLCSISGLLEIVERYGAKLAVATGGTFARRFVEQYRPRAIVAIACERDLASGIMDTNPLPVLGVLNRRPQGPCLNTEVDLPKVEEALIYFVGYPVPVQNPEVGSISDPDRSIRANPNRVAAQFGNTNLQRS